MRSSQYHVSPSAIIHRPLNLLEWCSRYGITYSFSPNFLIAQLCKDQSVAAIPSGALNLSALVAFISGGEAVPIKTAIEFANLIERFGAPRNSLRAGFGMSETGVRISMFSSAHFLIRSPYRLGVSMTLALSLVRRMSR